ncbi:MAG TPA: hypothetical protein DCY20_07740 [Firmicutes bacterium]|nr:hypothetical protein [Bacillota bacterium]
MSENLFRIKIDLEDRLLTVYKNNKWFKEYPVAIGKKQTPTPKGNFTIINKQVSPGGAFGARWLGLNAKGIGIHGTNDASSIGRAVSHGCIRLHNHHVIDLFQYIEVNTTVEIV